MSPSLTRFLHAIGPAAATVAMVVGLIFSFYLYEDWAGARAWTKAKEQMVAAGVPTDPQAYIPPDVPKAENFAALPIFDLGPDPRHAGYSTAPALDKALEPIYQHVTYPGLPEYSYKPGMLPYLGPVRSDDKPIDMAVVRTQLQAACAHHSPPIPITDTTSPCEMLGLLCPVLGELRAANAMMPLCRFNIDYLRLGQGDKRIFEANSMLGVFSDLNSALTYEERLAILDHQPQLCLDDFEIFWKIHSGLHQTPRMYAGGANIAVFQHQRSVVSEGLGLRVWNDQQLAALDQDLGKLDFLADAQFCFYGDFVMREVPLVNEFKSDRSRLVREVKFAMENKARSVEMDRGASTKVWVIEFPLAWLKARLEPNGWLDTSLADHAQMLISQIPQMIDLKKRRIFPQNEGEDPNGPVDEACGFLQLPLLMKHFACGQVQLDMARIACRLERYRLAHGSYPDALDVLTTDYGESPHDIMSGQPYHYQKQVDGTYRLYSSGWDLKNDGKSKLDTSWDWAKS